MQVANDSWQLVGAGGDASLVVQNVDVGRIAYVFAAAQPGPTDITLDGDGHGVLNPGSDPMTITDLGTNGKNMYARALGPKTPLNLYVEAN